MKKTISLKQSSLQKKTWENWVSAHPDDIDMINGKIHTIRNPDWYGATIKGQSIYNFQELNLNSVIIFKPFAEALNIQRSVFTDVLFDDGDFSRANFQNCKFLNCKFNKTIFTDANFNGSSFINCNLNR